LPIIELVCWWLVIMKISLNWLRDYVQTPLGPEQIAQTLSDLGFPCEGIDHLEDDTVIDLEITSNRGDCLGHIAIARELAAATGSELKMPDVQLDQSDRDVAEFASVEIADPRLCPRYTARMVEAVKVGPSPAWMVKRLEAVGMRSVNNVVDATNYAMMETGQPPHAFDYAKIAAGRIVVRRARAGERIVSIDGTMCNLEPDMLVIADAKKPVAIAGVMGGLETEVSEATTTILLEDASFDPVSVRTTSRRLGLASEAAFRFERGVDIQMIDWASKRTCKLITQVAGGKVIRGVVDVYPGKPTPKQVRLRLSRLKTLLGTEIPQQEVIRILAALSFEPRLDGQVVVCSVPSWRADVYREVDLIEEVARVYGYGRVPTQRKIQIEVVPVGRRERITDQICTFLNGCGYYETINVSFVDSAVAEFFSPGGPNTHLSVSDQARRSANLLRQSLIGSLLNVLKTNINAKNCPCRVFEIANTFIRPEGQTGLPVEETKLALAGDVELRELTGVIEGLVRTLQPDAKIAFVPAELAWAEPGAQITVDANPLGCAGIVSNPVRDLFGFKDVQPCAAELSFERLLQLPRGPLMVKPIPRFPAIRRDLSIIVDEAVRWSQISTAVNSRAPAELEDVQFVGIYRGRGVPSGRKSVTLSLRFRDEDGTLTHEQVDRFEKSIVEALARDVRARLRTV